MVKETGYYKKRRILKQANFLDLTPVRKYAHELDQQGNMVILVPRFTGFVGKRWIQPRLKNPWIKVSLDPIGSTTCKLADGKNTVRQICTLAENELGEKIQPVHDRVTTFFSQLYMRKLITFREILT